MTLFLGFLEDISSKTGNFSDLFSQLVHGVRSVAGLNVQVSRMLFVP